MRPVAAVPLMLMLGIAAPTAYAGYTAVDLYTISPAAGLSTADLAIGAQVAAGGQVAGAGTTNGYGSTNHAVVWNAAGTPIDLHPTGAVDSLLNATSGIQQVGYASFGGPGLYQHHAFLWNGTPGSGVDLNPDGFFASEAYGSSGDQQVGFAFNATRYAILWRGTASSAVDLGLAGGTGSQAFGTDGVHQVGYAVKAGLSRATLWSGTAASAVDLSPTHLPAFNSSVAYGVSGNEQVGWANNRQHALLWRGTGDSAVDLSPAGALASEAWGTNGTQEVGDMDINGVAHAVVWSGTAASAVDLQQFLPSGWRGCRAYTIDESGDIFGIATDASYGIHAVEWQTPEPTSLGLIGLLVLLSRRSR